ncbi:conserved hypothetical protein [Vibrio nigripulchritudo SFn118]|nr:conserved hypothetical protein [Vibrio nigripulchritudo SFn118]
MIMNCKSCLTKRGFMIELREYKLFEGEKENWLKFMDEVVLPHQIKCGMKILFQSIYEDESKNVWFVWARQYDSEEHKIKANEATYNEWWISEVRPKVFTMIDKDAVRVRWLEELG